MKVQVLGTSANPDVSRTPFMGQGREFDEGLIFIEAEELAASLFDSSYYDLPLGLRTEMRSRAIEMLYLSEARPELRRTGHVVVNAANR